MAADPSYYGYGRSYGYGPARAYHPYGGSSYTYRSVQGYGKRSADAEPEADADADAEPGYKGYGGYAVGYPYYKGAYGYLGYPVYGRGYNHGYKNHYLWKR